MGALQISMFLENRGRGMVDLLTANPRQRLEPHKLRKKHVLGAGHLTLNCLAIRKCHMSPFGRLCDYSPWVSMRHKTLSKMTIVT